MSKKEEHVQLEVLEEIEEEVKEKSKEMKKEEKKDKVIEDIKKHDKEVITTSRGDKFTLEEWKSPIAENGPTRQEVEEWKDKYGQVYFTPYTNDEFYIWRRLTREEYRRNIEDTSLSLLDREELVSETCVLFPRNYKPTELKETTAGIPSLLSESIMEKSGFVAESAPIKL